MAHEIREHDEQHGRSQAWHGLTKVNPDLSLSQADFYLKRWDVIPCGIRAVDLKTGKMMTLNYGGENGKWQALAVLPSKGDTLEQPLFVSTPYTDSYSPLNNGEFLGLIEKSLAASGIPLDVESAGSVFNRRRTFVSIKLPGMDNFEAGGRKFNAFLNFINSFDQSTPFLANTSNVCTVCNNTLMMNLSAGGCLVKHTKNMPERLEKLPDVIAEALTVQQEFANDFMSLASVTITPDDAKAVFAAFVVNNGALSTRAFNIAERLQELFVKGAGNKGHDFSDMFSAFTDYYSHESAGGNNPEKQMKQYQSSEFGEGALTKRQAMKFLMNIADNSALMRETVDKGQKLLTDYAKQD